MARHRADPAPPRVAAPDLPAVLEDAGALGPHLHVVGVRLDLLEGQVHAAHGALSESLIPSASVDDVDLTGTRLSDVLVENLRAAAIHAPDSRWQTVTFTGGRIGSLGLRRGELSSVAFRGLRIDYLSLPSARLTDVLFEDCQIGALDAPEAQLTRVGFVDCRADEVDSRGLRCADVDLRGLETLAYSDPRGLGGATMTPPQAERHAVAFAHALGIRIDV